MTKTVANCVLAGLLILTGIQIGCSRNQAEVRCPEEAENAAVEKLDYTKSLEGITTIEDAVNKVTTALSAQGFGVVTDMDVQAIMKKKLGKEMRPYRILGACNPKLAHQAIEQENTMGLLLPCKVILYQTADDQFWVSFARPSAVFQLVQNPSLAPIAGEVDTLIRQVFESL